MEMEGQGGSVSLIRQFVFGKDKQSDGWKFNSLTHHKKKISSEYRTPSFKLETKKHFFLNWGISKTSSRYASTPDLKRDDIGCGISMSPSACPSRPSVKKLVQNFEDTAARVLNYDSSLTYHRKLKNLRTWSNSRLSSTSESDLTSACYARVSKSPSLGRFKEVPTKSATNPKVRQKEERCPATFRNGVDNPMYLAVSFPDSSTEIVEDQFSSRRVGESSSVNSKGIYVEHQYPNLESHLSNGSEHLQDETVVNSNPQLAIPVPGRNLSHCVTFQDLNTKDAGPDPPEKTKEGKPRRPPERRESGRFQSAARILRSLGGRNRDQEDGRGRETASLNRSNPHYHSEGKGANKTSVEKESTGPSHKERSKSFCDKPEAKKRYSQENKKLRKDSSASKLERRNKSASELLTETSSSSLKVGTKSEPSSDEGNNSYPRPSSEFGSVLHEEATTIPEESDPLKSEISPQHNEVINEETETEVPSYADAAKKATRPNRKLTKDSGYETSPYSEGDYANLTPSSASESNGPPENGPGLANYSISPEVNPEQSTPERINFQESSQCEESNFPESASAEFEDSTAPSPPKTTALQRIPSAESLNTFADALLEGVRSQSPSLHLPPVRGSLALCQYDITSSAQNLDQAHESRDVNPPLQGSRSTPNLEDTEDGMMVTKKHSMYSYLDGSSNSRKGGPISSQDPYWDIRLNNEDNFSNPANYAHHLRSSSYQLIHSRQLSSSSYNNNRQSSNASNYSDGEDICLPKSESISPTSKHGFDRSRCFSFDSLGGESEVPTSYPASWNISEPDLSLSPSIHSTSQSFFQSQKYGKGEVIHPSLQPVSLPLKNSYASDKLHSSPPPPPVRDASSLKYIRYGPGHEKFPSWPVPAGTASFVGPPSHFMNSSGSYLADGSHSYQSPPQGSHRSHSWTEQSEYPKEKCGGYTRPIHKKQFSPSFQKQLRTVMEKCEKIPPEMFQSCPPEELLRSSNYSLIDAYLQQSTYYPLYDRDGRGIDDKDYSIPSPPEHDPGMGEAHLSQVTMEELEEHARRCDLAYGDHSSGDFVQITPLLDQLRQESYTWDGSSERDSGRGESESFTDSRYSNGRESVTTVVTNSSSASSSETLKWHGSLSDISVMSGQSRDPRQDQNVVHSARVQAPQRHNSESVLYYGRGKQHGGHKGADVRLSKEGYSRNYKDSLWSREVERNNEMNNLKKFPSYSYTQPLSQINEAPLAESGESAPAPSKSPISPTVDLRKPPSVAERINELERQSRSTKEASNIRWQRDRSEPRDVRHYHDESRGFSLASEPSRKMSSERDLRIEALQSKCDMSYLDSTSLTSSVTKSKSSGGSVCRGQSDDCLYSSDATPLPAFTDADRSSKNTSYSYLDPDKKCKISGATLKNIQKQALLSFYERRTGKSLGGSPGASFSSASNGGGDGRPSKWARQSLRGGSKVGKGMARLGRVPDHEAEDGLYPLTPVRSRSVSGGREKICDPNSIADSSPLSLMLPSKELPPELPAKPQNHMNLASVNSSLSQEEEKDLERDCRISQESYRRLSPSKIANDILSTPRKEPLSATKPPPPLPPGPSLPNETPPKPPERPPKKPNLRSLFHGPQSPASEPLPEVFEPQESESKELLTPRTYYYRKPPAPDPPQTIADAIADNVAMKSPISRSPTPELPPPPPPPVTEEMEVVVFDEPLPPPPTSEETVPPPTSPPRSPSKKIVSSPLTPVTNGNYHKDSYMAHRRDWKTGYEGRYRRTHSPSATDRNIVNGRGREYFINNNNNNNNNLKISHSMTQSSPTANKPPVLYKNKGNMRSAVSTSSLLKRPTSPSNKDVLLNNSINDNDYSLRNINNNINNDWASHPYQTSTTVDFTSDELKAFKARQAALESKPTPVTSSYSIEFNPCDSMHYTSPLRPLTRAVSVGEPLLHNHIETSFVEATEKLHSEDDSFICRPLAATETSPLHSSSSTLTSSPSSSSISRCNSSSETINAASEQSSSSSSPSKCLASTHDSSCSPVSHDGPVTAHPATVTEERTSCPVSPSPSNDSSEPFAYSPGSAPDDIVLRNDSHTSSQHQVSSPSASNSIESTSSLVSTSSASLNRCISASNLESPTKPPIAFNRSLSSTGTYPAMTTPDLSPEEHASRENIVVLGYGRTPNPEEIDCNLKSLEFVERHDIDQKLHHLLAAPSSGYKSTACYMEGVFALELRRDLLCLSHANHPDLRNDDVTPADLTSNDHNCSSSSEKAPLSADSAYFTTSEVKAKMLSKLRLSPTPHSADHTQEESHILAKRKEDLIRSISRKVEILQSEQTAIKEEMSLNLALGLDVTSKIESRAKTSESDKYKLHVEEIDKITSLLLGLSGRLARAENALVTCSEVNPEEKRILEGKRDKLKEQLEEAKRLKENIDRRAIHVSRIVTQYLSEEEYADYDHFTKMKAKLLMDAKEIDDKVKLGEEQLDALRKSLPNL